MSAAARLSAPFPVKCRLRPITWTDGTLVRHARCASCAHATCHAPVSVFLRTRRVDGSTPQSWPLAPGQQHRDGERIVGVAYTSVDGPPDADEELFVRLGAAACPVGDNVNQAGLSAAHVAALTPAAAVRMALLLCDARTPLQMRVNAARTLYLHAEEAASRAHLLSEAVVDALCAVAKDYAFSAPAAVRVPESLKRAAQKVRCSTASCCLVAGACFSQPICSQAACSGPGRLVIPPEHYVEMLMKVAPALSTPSEAVSAVRVFATVSALHVLNMLLQDGSELGTPDYVRAGPACRRSCFVAS